jgi:hypothetical protein
VAAAAEQEAGRAHRVWGNQDAAGAAGGSIFGVVMVVVCVRETAKEPPSPTPERDPARKGKEREMGIVFFPLRSLAFVPFPARFGRLRSGCGDRGGALRR